MKKRMSMVLICLIALLTMMTGCSDANAVSNDGTPSEIVISETKPDIVPGTYSAVAEGISNIEVTVTVDNAGTITDLEIDASGETADVGGLAAEKLQDAILARQTVQIDSISGATVTSTAVLAAVSDALTQAGINPTEMIGIEVATSEDEEATVDVVVIGAGTSGTGAALAASEKGAKVMVLEKTGKVGGMGTTGLGLFATESSLQEEAGVTVTSQEMFEYLENYNHYRSNGALVKAIIDKSGDTIDWLMDNGIGLHMGLGVNQKLHADSPKTYHMWDNSNEDFPALYERLQEEYDLELRLNTRGMELIQDSNGSVVGIIAEKEDGSKLTVHADAVILSTGGFGSDLEMMQDLTEINEFNYFGIGNKGDGVKMAWAAGADKLGDHVLQIHLGDLAGSKTIYDRYGDNAVAQVKDAPLLWVNKEGTRFVNEGVCYDNVLWGNATYSVGGEYLAIVDQASVDKFIEEGINMTGAYQMNGSGLMCPQGGNDINITIPPLPSLQEDFETLIEQGIAFKGDTVEELAAASGMNPEKLQNTLDMYNEAVETGIDNHFYKDREYLQYSVEAGPYYAIRVRGSVYGSIGGVRINEDIQALDESGYPIPGLYAAGAVAGGMYDNSYPDVEGVTMAFAMNSGRIAGENAAESSQK